MHSVVECIFKTPLDKTLNEINCGYECMQDFNNSLGDKTARMGSFPEAEDYQIFPPRKEMVAPFSTNSPISE